MKYKISNVSWMYSQDTNYKLTKFFLLSMHDKKSMYI